jgi:hypothetical protein
MRHKMAFLLCMVHGGIEIKDSNYALSLSSPFPYNMYQNSIRVGAFLLEYNTSYV